MTRKSKTYLKMASVFFCVTVGVLILLVFINFYNVPYKAPKKPSPSRIPRLHIYLDDIDVSVRADIERILEEIKQMKGY